MALRKVWAGGSLSLVGVILACILSSAAFPVAQNQAKGTPKSEENTFTERDATPLLNQIAEALVAHNRRMMLAAFDVAKMTDGQLFQQQITSLFGQTGIIRVHFNLAQVVTEDGKGVAMVDWEMDADRRDDSLPPIRKQAQLRFVAEKSADGWKFTDVEPRAFFSIAQP